jgi:hypothetical protein
MEKSRLTIKPSDVRINYLRWQTFCSIPTYTLDKLQFNRLSLCFWSINLTNVTFLEKKLSSLRYLRRLQVELDLCNFCNFSRCSSHSGLIPTIKRGNFWYSPIVIVTWSPVVLARLWYSSQSVQKPSSHSEHKTADDLVMWRTLQTLHATVEVAIL